MDEIAENQGVMSCACVLPLICGLALKIGNLLNMKKKQRETKHSLDAITKQRDEALQASPLCLYLFIYYLYFITRNESLLF